MTLLRILVIVVWAVASCATFATAESTGVAEARAGSISSGESWRAGATPGNRVVANADGDPHRRLRPSDENTHPPSAASHVISPRDGAGAGVRLTTAERAWLAQLPVLRVGIDPTAAPLSFIGRDGTASGLSVDYLDDALALLGLRSTSVATTDWPETVQRASAGQIDLLAAASPRNNELGKRFDFTEAYVEFPVMIVTREDTATIAGPADLGGRRVAANMSLGGVAKAVHRLPMVDVIDVRTTSEGLDAVATGRADAYVGDIATAEYVIRREYPARLKLAAPTEERAELAIAVERRYAPLLPLLNRALASIPERRTQAIRNTWLRSEYTWGGSWQEIARKVGPAGVAVLVLLFAVTYAYLRLRREIRRRQSSEEQLADVTRHIPAVFYRFRYHASGRIEFTYVGGNPVPIFGVTVDTFLHDERRAFASVDPRDQGAVLAEVARAAGTLTPIHSEMRIRDVVPERWVASHAVPRQLAEAVEFTGYWIDVSDRHEQAAQLAEAKRTAEAATAAKSQFLATMSHEIRTPMHGVIGMLDMLRDTRLDEGQHRLLDTAETSAEALLQILDDVLDFSRIEAGRLDVEHVPFDLRRTIQGILELFSRQAQLKGLSTRARFDEHLAPRIVSDGGRVRQVLLNLVSNAIKFTEEGEINVIVDVLDDSAETQRIRVVVVDTGIGIERADIDRLFAPFSQAEASTTRRFGGSGLGLAICRRLVNLLGGDIAMTSEAGKGTRVTVVLDVGTHADASVESAVPTTTAATSRHVLSVLVAEDNATNRELVGAQLDRLGHRYCIVADGAEALAIARTHPVDVLLTDLHMPVMDGYTLTTELRARGMTFRIVAMTANAMPGEKERCMALGMDGFVTKPLRLAELDALLSSSVTGEAATPPWDLEAWRDSFGDLRLLPAMVDRFEIEVREDLSLVPGLKEPREAAEWVHRILGGMRIFGPSPEAALAEELEEAFRGSEGAAAMTRLPELVRAIGVYLDRLRHALPTQHDA